MRSVVVGSVGLCHPCCDKLLSVISMESFTITVDLRSFFDDYRAKSVVFVDTNLMKKVKHVVHHIKTVFGIQSDAYVFSHDNFVPGAEDSRVLKTLPSIRLEILSSSNQCDKESESNANDERQDLESIPTTNSNQDEISYVDKDEHSNDTGHLSKKKKHKRKRVDNDIINFEYSSSQQDVSDDLSSIPHKVVAPKGSKVRKTSNSYSSVVKDTPNSSFYGKVYQLAVQNDQLTAENMPKRNGHESSREDACNIFDNVSNLNTSTLTDIVASDSNANTGVMYSKPKRTRIRKRKKCAKSEADFPEDTETKVPQVIGQPTLKTSKLLTSKSNHIYFTEDEPDQLETQTKTPEAKNIPMEDVSRRVPLNCPERETGNVQEQEILNQPILSDDVGQKINNLPSMSEDPLEGQDTNTQSIVTEDTGTYSGTDDVTSSLPIVKNITQQKPPSHQVEKGLGKLLSLVRSENPPVFERKKVMKTVQSPKRATQSPVLFVTEKAVTPSSTSQSDEILTPLKVIPEANTKIAFKILKMSASYCPELSNSIVAIVKEVNQETQELLLKIINGAEECKKPKGKFDLDHDPEGAEEEIDVDEIKLNWLELIGPCTCP